MEVLYCCSPPLTKRKRGRMEGKDEAREERDGRKGEEDGRDGRAWQAGDTGKTKMYVRFLQGDAGSGVWTPLVIRP
jgi:hypothetical protein